MNEKFQKLGFYPADILLPKDADMTKWAVVACDQFTSQPEYWQAVEETVGDAPSTLRLILPEAKLNDPGVDAHIADINGAMNRYLAEGYREKLQWTIGQIGHLRGQLKKQGWTVMMDSDPLKLTIFTGEKGYRGREVAEVLRAHEVECEFADLDAVVLMATPENTERDFQRIEKALERLPQKEKIEPTQMPQILPKQKMRIREAIFGRWEEISCEEAVGRICASPCVSCPPAIPIAASGEEITAELLPFFRAYGIEKIEVVKE